MRLSFPRALLTTLIVIASAQLYAAQNSMDHNRFKWRDAAGNLHYSDALPVDAAKLGYDVISPRGLIVKHVERAQTAAELAASRAALAREKASQDSVDAQTRADEQLVSGYPEESDLKRAQQQKLALLDQRVSAAKISLRSQEQTLADMLDRAAEAERDKKTLPAIELDQLAKMRKQVDEQRLAVARRESERSDANAGFDRETARYRALKAKLAEQRKGQ